MSRALNINATQAHIVASCAKQQVEISTIEPLQSGGTRVVLLNSADTAAISKTYGSKVLAGPVRRMPIRLSRNG